MAYQFTTNLIVAWLFTAAVLLSGEARGVLSSLTSMQSIEYVSAVTGHAVLFVFVILPAAMLAVPWWWRQPINGGVKHLTVKTAHTTPGFVAGTFVVVLFPSTAVNSGWTFYQPLIAIVCPEVRTNLLLTLVLSTTILFLAGATESIFESSGTNTLASRQVATLAAGHVFAVFIMPLLLVAVGSLLLDRMAGIAIFDYPLGSPATYETLFWVFGHPEVYLLILPFTGWFFFTRRLAGPVAEYTKSRRSVPGFNGSLVRIAVVSFFVWGHHLFATSLTGVSKTFFILASLYIMIPMFDILRRTFRSRRYTSTAGAFSRTALFFGLMSVLGFFIGGILALFFLSPHLSTAVHGTRWIVGHFHFFFVVFLFSVVAVLFILLINTAQTTGALTLAAVGRFVILVSLIFFTATVASGLFGGLRRAVVGQWAGSVYMTYTNTATVALAFLVFYVWVHLVSHQTQPKIW